MTKNEILIKEMRLKIIRFMNLPYWTVNDCKDMMKSLLEDSKEL